MTSFEVPGYEILEQLPQGGMSAVYKARQLSLNRVVALKTLPPQMISDPADVEQFTFEAQQAAKLKHPGIVQVYDCGEAQGSYYFVMEFISGYSVAEWMKRSSRLPESDALVIAEAVAKALDYAWETARMIHCDIKPDNVMIDGDGTIKVADLGLARTVGKLGDADGPLADFVMGTPNYIAPEQSMGDKSLDCRTDVYSLGAMLYFLVTGQLPFGEFTDTQVMDKQITSQVEDPCDIQPDISCGMATLIEIMMAKDPARRQSDWKAVSKDLAHVKAGYLPVSPLPPDGHSTVKRGHHRSAEIRRLGRPTGRRLPPLRWIALPVLMPLAAVLAYLFLFRARPGTDPQPPPVPSPAEARAQAEQLARITRARERLTLARQWAAQHPGQHAEALARFRRVAQAAEGTRFAPLVDEEIGKVKQAQRAARDRVLQTLRDTAAPHLARSRFARAIAVYRDYDGPFAEQTRKQREAQIAAIHERQEAARKQEEAAQRRVAAKRDAFFLDVAGHILDADVFAARQRLREAKADPELKAHYAAFERAVELAEMAATLDARILASFARQRGDEISVGLRGGAETLFIRSVASTKIHAEKVLRVASGRIQQPVVFGPEDLTTTEKRARLGSDDSPETALLQGILSWQTKAYPSAITHFGKTDPVLAPALVRQAEARRVEEKEKTAARALHLVLRAAGLQVAEHDPDYWLAALREQRFTDEQADFLRSRVAAYRSKYGQTQFGLAAEPVLKALANVPTGRARPRRDDTLMGATDILLFRRAVGALAADAQGNAVKTKFFKQNPDVQRDDVTFTAGADGAIVHVEILSSALRDLGPIAALTGLQQLVCAPRPARRGRGGLRATPLKDLEALRGLPLKIFRCEKCMIGDLAPLAGMPLTMLFLADTYVSDLSPLRGMPLQTLRVNNTYVKDLSALTGMPLRQLNIAKTLVTSLAPLAGMPLSSLNLNDTSISDLSPLHGAPLQNLSLAGSHVVDLAVVGGMPLESLNIRDTGISDLRPLRNAPLRVIWLDEPDAHAKLLAALPKLERVNGRPAPK